MEKIKELLEKEFGEKYNFLQLYEVDYTVESKECVIVFLYPHDMKEIPQDMRDELLDFINRTIKLNGKCKLKFKKSFLDSSLIKKEVSNYIAENFKAISSKIKDGQLAVDNRGDITKISFTFGKEVGDYFEVSGVKKGLTSYLKEKFISEFEIELKVEERLNLTGEIGEVELPTIVRKNKRYQVEIINKLFGGEIIPSPEFIKDNTEPKSDVILAGKVSDKQKKTFVRKKGKLQGQEGVYYTFTLNDDSKIDCVYFCPKSNERKMDVIVDDMSIVCVGDIKFGLSGKLTYYIKKVALAHILQDSKTVKETSLARKPVVLPEEYIEIKQANFLQAKPSYNPFIMSNNFVVYDLETTGLDSSVDKIIEIGAVKVVGGKVIQKFSTFVNPEMHIPDDATKINNITDEMVKDAPKIQDAFLDFMDFCKGCVVCGYNSTNFDNKFISRFARELQIPFHNQTEDVFLIARNANLQSRNFKLTTVAEFLGISLENAHRAYNDAYATAQVLLKLNEIKAESQMDAKNA